MDVTPLVAVAQAALWGFLHAVNPCVHSWPTLLPFLGPGRGVLGPGLLFALGATLAGVGWGVIAGLVGTLPSEEVTHRIEEISGVVLVLLGLLFLFRPQALHSGHLHRGHVHQPGKACEHAEGPPVRLADRAAPHLALFLLGSGHVAIPHPTNLAVIGMALGSASVLHGVLIMGTFGLVTGVVMMIVLALLHRGLRVLDRLAAGKALPLLLRASGLILLVFGLSMIFHWWHEH